MKCIRFKDSKNLNTNCCTVLDVELKSHQSMTNATMKADNSNLDRQKYKT